MLSITEKIEVLKFSAVGLLINLLGYFLYIALTKLGTPIKTAMSIVYFIGILAGFFGHGIITFEL